MRLCLTEDIIVTVCRAVYFELTTLLRSCDLGPASCVRPAVRSLCLTQTHANVSVRVLTVCIPGKSRTACVLQVVVPLDVYPRVELDLGSCVTNE